MRARVPNLTSPYPLAEMLPALYQEDDFARRLVTAFDEELAPVHCTLDNLERYLQPAVSPGDFLQWVASWVGAELDDNWPDERRREAVARAAPMHRRRGTCAGLAEQVSLVTGGVAEVVDSGGSSWSSIAGAALPGAEAPSLAVTVRVADPASVDLARLDLLVAQAKPAHVPHTVEVVEA
jgi:phage tail-like protein